MNTISDQRCLNLDLFTTFKKLTICFLMKINLFLFFTQKVGVIFKNKLDPNSKIQL